MKINIAKSAGFCFGVRRAIKIALGAVKSSSIIEMLGDIVHNEEVVRDMQDAGIRKVLCLTRGKNKKLLIRAHGVALKTIINAKKLGYGIIDATCPMVKEIHKIAIAMEKNGRKIIIIGDRSHTEVRGIIGHLKTVPLIIESAKNIHIVKIRRIKRAGVVVQSTQNIEKVNKILDTLKEYIKDLKFFNTICSTTGAKQNEVKKAPND